MSAPTLRALVSGTRIGPYEIVQPIGAGGMGEVYRAHDARMGRDVAIKLLPVETAGDVAVRRRFEQEARAVAQLSHPNILAIHDVGMLPPDVDVSQSPFIVTELLQGQTLRDQLGGRPLPRRKAIECAIQIARGLSAAHDKHLVHRDLKPENVFVTKDGHVKILDFGLAKWTSDDARHGENALTQSQPGTVVGTVGYMSPEQVRGQEIDHRSDVFSLGVVLYEMLTGRRAFRRDTAAETMAAIMRDEPAPVTEADPTVPLALQRVIARCIEKTPDARFQSASDLAFALESLSDITSTAATAQRRRLRPAAIGALLILVAAVLAVVLWRPWPDATPRPVQRFAWPLEDALLTGLISPFALTPDDAALIYVARSGLTSTDGTGGLLTSAPGSGLFLRPMNALEATRIPGTEGGRDAFFSPDGKWLGFVSSGDGGVVKIIKVPLGGGTPAPVVQLDRGGATGVSWGPNDSIVYAQTSTGLWRVPASGGTPEILYAPPDSPGGKTYVAKPTVLDRGAILFTSFASGKDLPSAMLLQPDGSVRKLAADAIHAQYVPPGYLVFGRGNTLMAAKLDLRRPESMSAPIVVLEGVAARQQIGQFYSLFYVSASGSLAYVPGSLMSAPRRTYFWIDRGDGHETPWPFGPQEVMDARLSPEGTMVTLNIREPASFGALSQVWIGDLARGTKQLLSDAPVSGDVAWTRTGRLIFSKSDHSLWWRSTDLSTPETQLAPAEPSVKNGLDVSPDGRTLIWSARVDAQPGVTGLWLLTGLDPAVPSGLSANLSIRRFHEDNTGRSRPRFSPDGKWLAYVANTTSPTVVVEAFPGPGPVVAVSSVGGISTLQNAGPTWRGNELLWAARNGDVMGVTYTTSPTFKPSAPRLILPKPAAATIEVDEISADGRRFVGVRNDSPAVLQSRINIVINWVEELKQRLK